MLLDNQNHGSTCMSPMQQKTMPLKAAIQGLYQLSSIIGQPPESLKNTAGHHQTLSHKTSALHAYPNLRMLKFEIMLQTVLTVD